jgi:hypothetical protein
LQILRFFNIEIIREPYYGRVELNHGAVFFVWDGLPNVDLAFAVTAMRIILYDDPVHNSRLALSAFVHHFDFLNMFCVYEHLSFCMCFSCSLDTLFNKNVIGVHKKCKKKLACITELFDRSQ